jgi:hypothetical protein
LPSMNAMRDSISPPLQRRENGRHSVKPRSTIKPAEQRRAI